MPIPPLPDVYPCEELIPVEAIEPDVARVVQCGQPARVEYIRRPHVDGLLSWVAACDVHADIAASKGLWVRPFTGLARW